MNSEKPIRIKMIPPTMRTMGSGTPNRRRIKVPKMKKKAEQQRVEAGLQGDRAMRCLILAGQQLQIDWQDLERVDYRE
jgi:hypothetical protein